jgi:hypothetical protein
MYRRVMIAGTVVIAVLIAYAVWLGQLIRR